MKTNHFYHRVMWLMIPLLSLFNTSAWGAGAISVSTTMKVYPNGASSGCTTVGNNDWYSKGAPNSYNDPADDATINSDGSFTFYNAACFNNDSKLQLKASGGYIETTISSPAGVDVTIGLIKGSSGTLTVSLTGATNKTYTSTSWGTLSISTTSTSATLKICKTGSKTAGISFIAIVPKQAGGSGDYVLVENAGDIESGKYLLVYNNAAALSVPSGGTNSNTYSPGADISSYYSSKKITANATTNAYAYEIVTSPNGYVIKKSSDNSFLGFSSTAQNPTGDYLRWDTKFSESKNEWTIGVNSIVSTYSPNANSYAIRYNTTYTKFGIYLPANQSAVQLFKKVDAGCSDLDPLNGSFW